MLELVALLAIIAALTIGPILADHLISLEWDKQHEERMASDDLLDAARGRF